VERFCREDVCDLILTQAFYKPLDENKEYWCSLSTLYRLFRVRGLNARRTPTREARLRSRPTAYSAEKPNEVRIWDITYLHSSAYTARFYYAYVIVDVYSRMVVSARVFDADNADFDVRFLRDSF
jgi:transposase InsO family protein